MSTEVVFTGDISFSKHFENGWNNPGLLAPEIEHFLQRADHVVGNVESPVTDAAEYQSTRMLNHSSNPQSAAFLAEKGIRIWNLANNHMMDCGSQGLADTVRYADENGCAVIGAGTDTEKLCAGKVLGTDVKVGLIAVAKPWEYIKAGTDGCGVFTWDQTEMIRTCIKKLRENADWVVMVVHGGDEFSEIAMPYMREQYHRLISFGADVIVAHHPHIVQEYEKTGQKYIFYSLGNFIFDTDHQRKFAHTENGILLKICFEKDSFSFQHLPICINRKTQTVEAADSTPAVFREIDAEQYRFVWPYAARSFYRVDLRKRKMTIRSMRGAPSWKIFLHELYTLRKKEMRVVQKGRLKAALRIKAQKVPEELLSYFDESAGKSGGKNT